MLFQNRALSLKAMDIILMYVSLGLGFLPRFFPVFAFTFFLVSFINRRRKIDRDLRFSRNVNLGFICLVSITFVFDLVFNVVTGGQFKFGSWLGTLLTIECILFVPFVFWFFVLSFASHSRKQRQSAGSGAERVKQ